MMFGDHIPLYLFGDGFFVFYLIPIIVIFVIMISRINNRIFPFAYYFRIIFGFAGIMWLGTSSISVADQVYYRIIWFEPNVWFWDVVGSVALFCASFGILVFVIYKILRPLGMYN